MSIDQAALDRGRSFEKHVADISGGSLIPASGATWSAKGDCVAVFLVQCKASSKRSWAQTRRELKGAIDDSVGTGRSAALAILEEDGEELVVCRLSDLVEILSSDVRLPASSSNGEMRRQLASTPGLLRELEDGVSAQLRR